jgi:hypothetical protein
MQVLPRRPNALICPIVPSTMNAPDTCYSTPVEENKGKKISPPGSPVHLTRSIISHRQIEPSLGRKPLPLRNTPTSGKGGEQHAFVTALAVTV